MLLARSYLFGGLFLALAGGCQAAVAENMPAPEPAASAAAPAAS